MSNRGFSLTELIVVIALISIMLAVVTLNFNDWQVKYNIEAQVKEMLTDLTDVRSRAISTKQQHRVILNPTSYTFRRYSSEFDAAGTEVFRRPLKYQIQQFSTGTYSAFSNFTLTFDDRGYTTSLVTIAVGPGLGSPAYNCIGVHTARVNMGRINGNNCEYQ
ncbi:prepilin-type N-terminal cleavage/methylation domain-containing protein [Trichlorobacter lovleyi]|uniref:pilus assembly FimT family protein n=1 Tax=Trichlorobacter lovleyi TaxID=313985 RepID=UPI00224036F3|nr:prepilin-type N-terminal cleavage/methylation domain-containing protein [Trichlorobacter lovleyi]QOX79207.1 prepilin-type N-terminal cleavage/methylation domain-containing protein [Trichlorobacter lovleyi]